MYSIFIFTMFFQFGLNHDLPTNTGCLIKLLYKLFNCFPTKRYNTNPLKIMIITNKLVRNKFHKKGSHSYQAF